MTDESKSRAAHGKLMIWLVGGACAACCAFPVLGVIMGSAAMAGLAMFFERAALGVAAIAAGILLFKWLVRKPGPACKCAGACRPAASDQSPPRD